MFNPELRLSKNFRLSEFAVSRQFPYLAEELRFTDVQVERCGVIARGWLQPLREAVGRPVYILSGLRSPELNRAVGGAPGSDHLFSGYSGAVDVHAPGIPARELARQLLRVAPAVKYLIVYDQDDFIHLSLPDRSGRYGELFAGLPGGGYQQLTKGELTREKHETARP